MSGIARSIESGQRNVGLDLLRTLAIGMVLICHFWSFASAMNLGFVPLQAAILGFAGVELFYVLSGLLIGSLLLSALRRGPSFREFGIFILRRWMRTVPAYLLWLALLLLILPPPDGLSYALSYGTFTQNLAWPMPTSGWFAVSWSLTVEEWFYLLFSAFLFGAAALVPRRALSVALVVFLAVPLAARLLMPVEPSWDEEIRKVALLRMDAIAYGVLLARLLQEHAMAAGPWRGWSCLAGLTLLVGLAWFWVSDVGSFEMHGPILRALAFNWCTIGFALLFPLAMRFAGGPRWFQGLIGWVSRRAYGLYLVHFSLLELVGRNVTAGWPSAAGLAAAFVGTFLLADLSWRFVERPILLRRPQSPTGSDAAG